MTDRNAPAEPVDELLAALGEDLVAQLRAERAERVARAVATNRDGHFGALWLVAKTIADHEKGDLQGRPSKAAIRASHDAGYVEGLRDAACALLGLDSGELLDGLEVANQGLDFTSARNRIHGASPNMTLSHHLYP
jgi:hypothetical protein